MFVNLKLYTKYFPQAPGEETPHWCWVSNILAKTWPNVWVPYGVSCVHMMCMFYRVHASIWEVFQLEIWTWHEEQIHFVMIYLFPWSQVNSNGLNFGPSPFVLIKSITNIFTLGRHCVAMHGHSPHNVHPHNISCNQFFTSIFLCVTNFFRTKTLVAKIFYHRP